MNTLHFVYAIEVEKTGSVTQAADNLFMSQPTLSKAIRDLEETLGFSVFNRTSKGMTPTQKGIEFLTHAKKIVGQIEKMELALQIKDGSQQLFSAAIPRVGYIARGAGDFVSTLDGGRNMEIDILETGSTRVIDAVANSHFVLGIIRYRLEDEEYFLKSLAEKGLQSETIWQSSFVALLHGDSPLAGRDRIAFSDLTGLIEIAYGDDEVPYIRVSDGEPLSGIGERQRILVYDRGTRTDLLQSNPLAYAWSSPLSKETLRRNCLVQKSCVESRQFKDVLISRRGYRFSALDRAFLDRVYLQRNEAAYGG